MKKAFVMLLLGGFAFMASFIAGPARAQDVQGIAAVVNNDVISVYDLQARLSLVLAGSNTPDTPENRQRLAPEVLRRMIDETLEMQEAKRLNIRVTDQDIADAMDAIERQNHMPKGGLDAFLARTGISKLTLVNRLEPEIAWAKLVHRRLGPQIQVTPEEVDEALARIRASKGKPEYLLSEIFLRVDETENENQIRQAAHRIIQQIQRGANFAALAHNFSQDASANQGGDLGWVRADELDDELQKPVSQMQPGQVVGPIRTSGGFDILLLRDRRVGTGLPPTDQEVELQQLFFPVAANDSASQVRQVMDRARNTAAKAKSCADMEKLAKQLATPMSGGLGKVKTSALPASLQKAIRDLAIGRPSQPIRTDKGIVVLMVCGRQGQDPEQGARRRIEQTLFAQRLDTAARRYLRDLRRAAYIDIRL